MTRYESDSWRGSPGATALVQLARHPDVPLSVLAHVSLLGLLHYFGSYQPEIRQQEAEVASSLHATSLASAARSIQDLETIKRLLEKSAEPAERQAAEPDPAPAPLQTAEEMVERARELSRAIEALDQEIREEELAELSVDEPPPAAETPSDPVPPPIDAPRVDASMNEAPTAEDADPASTPVTAESAATEVAALEARARDILGRRQAQLEARANGVQVGVDSRASVTQGTGNTAVRAEIADFIGSGERSGLLARVQSGGVTGGDITGSGDLEVPAVDASALVRGHGRMIGADGEFANRIYVDSWYIIGPFQGLRRGRLRGNPVYPPEKAVLLDAVYFGKDGRLLKWRYVTSPAYPLTPPDAAEDAIYYGYTEVSVDEDCDLQAWFGADDDAQVWFNDRLVWPGGSVNLMRYLNAIWIADGSPLRDYNLTEGQRVLHFNKGRNKVLFKLSNGAQGTHLSFVLTR
jgi:hypothetical protein